VSARSTVARNTGFYLAAKLVYAAGWIVLTPRLLERLGQEIFGFWSLLMLLGGSLTFFDLGLTSAVTRYTAKLAETGSSRAITKAVGRALLLYSGFGLVVAAIGIAVTPLVLDAFRVPLPWRGEAAIAYRLAFAAFGVSTLSNVVQGALFGFQRVDLASGLGLILAPVLFGAVHRALDRPHPLQSILVAQLIWTALTAIGMVAALVWILRRFPAPGGGTESLANERVSVADESAGEPDLMEMARYGSRVQVGVLATFLNSQVDKLLVGALIGLAWVAPCELGLRLTNGLISLPQLFLAALLPALAAWDARNRGTGRDRLYIQLFEPYAALVIATGAAVVALAGPLIRAWLQSDNPSATLALRLTMVSATLLLLTGLATTLGRAGGRPGFEARMALLALGLHLPLAWIGLRFWGWPGALVGGAIACLVATAWLTHRVDRWLGVPSLSVTLPALARSTLPALIAAVAAFGVAYVLPSRAGRADAMFHVVLGGAAFALAYAAALFGLSPSFARRITQQARGVWPR